MIKNNKQLSVLGLGAFILAATFVTVPVSADTCPDTGASSASCDVEVKVTIKDYIDLDITAGKDATTQVPTGATDSSATSTIAVSTNSSKGYTLSVVDADNDNRLTQTVSGSVVASIASGSTTTPFDLDVNTASWGIRGVSSGGTLALSTTKFIGIPTVAVNYDFDTSFKPSTGNTVVYTNELATKVGTTLKVASNSAVATTAQSTVVQYGVAVPSSQSAGTYTDTIVYLATVNV